jgi:murein L,D-transpeptidase YcbB/YkuD
MRPISCIAFALFLAAPLTLPAYAAEPDSPDALIGRTEAVRAAIQERLSAKFTDASEARKTEQGALVEYYSVAENRLLWVDENGLNDRANAVIEEIGKADEYGLRPSDYALPKAAETVDTKWLADAEIKISFAVLGYARDARGGRIVPQRLTPNLDPVLALPNPLEVIESIAFRSEPAAYLRSFQPDQPQFEALRKALIAARGGNPDNDVVRILMVRRSGSASSMSRWRFSGSVSTSRLRTAPADHVRCFGARRRSALPESHGAAGWHGWPGTPACSMGARAGSEPRNRNSFC